MRNKLSFRTVTSAKPKEKAYRLGDGAGLSLIVRPRGNKAWEYRFVRPDSGKPTFMGLGSFPDTSLAEAREKAQQCRKLVKEGTDPILYFEQKKLQRKIELAQTFHAVAELWIETKKGRLKDKTIQGNWRKLELYAFPKLAKIPISEISAPFVIDALRPFEKKGLLESVKRTVQLINEVMNYAVNYGLIPFNPTAGVVNVFKAPKVKHMAAIEADQLQAFMQALASANMQLSTRCAIEWQLHTLTRPSEATGTRWDEIDLDKKLWIIPEGKMKKQRKHIIPLTPQTMALLEVMKPLSGHREHVFPSRNNPRVPIDSETPNKAISRMGYKNKTTAHGLRSLASTVLNEEGFDSDLIEVSLSHIDKNQIRAAYNRAQYIERRREMLQWWSKYIEKASYAPLSLTAMTNHI